MKKLLAALLLIASPALAGPGAAVVYGPNNSAEILPNALLYHSTSTPANPPAGKYKTYFKNDGLYYMLDSAGVETAIGSGAGGGITSVSTIDSQAEAANGAVIAGTAIYMQSASATGPGLVNTTSQTLAGTKTFSSTILGNLQGNVTGDLTGDVAGNVTGDLTGDVTGNTAGVHTGAVVGNVTGDVLGDVTGDLLGNVTGNVLGNVTGTVSGNAGTATALAADPTDCAANSFATSIAPSGNLTCAAVGDAALSTSYLKADGTRALTGNWNVGAFNITASTFIGALTGTASNVTTNANLTGPITSVGNATSIASQTGTGTKFVVDTSPTLVTPVIGAATGTSLSVSGQLTSTVATGTAPLAVSSTTRVSNLNAATAGNADTVTTNANLTGVITSVGNATSFNTTVPTTKGGTGLTSIGTALQHLRVNAAANALEFADNSGGGGLYAEGQNVISNNSFATATTGWTESAGTLTFENGAANVVPPGVGSAKWVTGASSRTLTSASQTITALDGLAGRNGAVSCAFKTSATDFTLSAYDGTNTLGSVTITAAPSGGFARSSVNFIMPASGTVALRISSGSSATIYVDDCYLGLSEGFTSYQVAQAQFIGSAYIPGTANCSAVSRTNVALGAMGTDTDCPGPTVELNPGPGTIQTTDTDSTIFTVNNLPPGNYMVIMNLRGSNSVSGDNAFAINDGTTTSGNVGFNGGSAAQAVTIIGNFSYTSTANRTFTLYGSASTGTISASNDVTTWKQSFAIYRWPSANELAYRPDQTPGEWSGYHDNNCSWTTTSSSFADPTGDASCTFTERTNTNFGTVTTQGSSGPGVTFTPKQAGRYEVCATIGLDNSTTGSGASVQLYDGTNELATTGFEAEANHTQSTRICGTVNASSVASTSVRLRMAASANTTTLNNFSPNRSIEWTITPKTANFAAPVFVGGVINNSAGSTKELTAVLNCDSSATITSQSGTTSEGVATIGNIASGVCAGTFAGMWSGTTGLVCTGNRKGSTLDLDADIDVTSATAFNVYCVTKSTGAAAAACDISVHCSGPK